VSQLILVESGSPSSLFVLWRDAFAPMRLEHPNRESVVVLKLANGLPPILSVGLDWTRDTVDGHRRDRFAVSSVRLCYFPGVRLAQAWMAAAWAGYCMHESLELVTADGVRPIDPHSEVAPGSDHRLAPYLYDRGLRDGLPQMLTRDTLLRTLCVVMDEDVARGLMGT